MRGFIRFYKPDSQFFPLTGVSEASPGFHRCVFCQQHDKAIMLNNNMGCGIALLLTRKFHACLDGEAHWKNTHTSLLVMLMFLTSDSVTDTLAIFGSATGTF